MSQLVVRDLMPTLKRLRRMSERDRKQFIRRSDSRLIKCICECTKNVLKGRVPLSRRQLKKLSSWKRCMRILSTRKPSLKTKKAVLLQKGGFLGALLAPVLSFLGGIVSSKIAGQ